jgi:hypothetical protein
MEWFDTFNDYEVIRSTGSAGSFLTLPVEQFDCYNPKNAGDGSDRIKAKAVALVLATLAGGATTEERARVYFRCYSGRNSAAEGAADDCATMPPKQISTEMLTSMSAPALGQAPAGPPQLGRQTTAGLRAKGVSVHSDDIISREQCLELVSAIFDAMIAAEMCSMEKKPNPSRIRAFVSLIAGGDSVDVIDEESFVAGFARSQDGDVLKFQEAYDGREIAGEQKKAMELYRSVLVTDREDKLLETIVKARRNHDHFNEHQATQRLARLRTRIGKVVSLYFVCQPRLCSSLAPFCSRPRTKSWET